MKRKLSLMLVLLFLVVTLVTPTTTSAGMIDNGTYPMGDLSPCELTATYLLPIGTVIVMSPNDATVIKGAAAENLVKTNQVTTVVMAGMGSSSQGTAAFAKHVAIATGVPVAGVVTGLGDGTAYTEGAQGYFIGRTANFYGYYYPEIASAKLASLYVAGARPEKLIGHSKGNLDVVNTLYKLKQEGRQSMYQGVRVITFGCGVNIPMGVGTFEQYMGTIDSVGIFNTVSYTNLTWVTGKDHTINPAIYATYLPVMDYVN